MQYFHFLNTELLFKCTSLVIFSYAFIIAVIELSILYVVLPVLLYLVISFISLNRPDEYYVTKVLGEDRRALLRNSDAKSDNSKESFACIAYQAAGLDSSEDVPTAMEMCWKNGCKFVQVDVRITSDNVAIVESSKSIISNRHQSEISIEESSFVDLSDSRISSHSKNTPEPTTLEEMIKLCKTLGSHIMMNVIHSSYYKSVDSTAEVILTLYEKYSFLLEQCAIASTNPWLLYKIRHRNKNIVVVLHWQSLVYSSTTTVSWLKKAPCGSKLHRCLLEMIDAVMLYLLRNFLHHIIGISAVILSKDVITPGVVEYWESKNIRCIAAIVNLSSEKWYYENALGITYLTETVEQRTHLCN